jgi:hypothetical protein
LPNLNPFALADQATFKGQATIVVTLPKQSRGNISFDIMCSVHAIRDSSLFFGDEIKSYDINYQNHQPKWGKMYYC